MTVYKRRLQEVFGNMPAAAIALALDIGVGHVIDVLDGGQKPGVSLLTACANLKGINAGWLCNEPGVPKRWKRTRPEQSKSQPTETLPAQQAVSFRSEPGGCVIMRFYNAAGDVCELEFDDIDAISQMATMQTRTAVSHAITSSHTCEKQNTNGLTVSDVQTFLDTTEDSLLLTVRHANGLITPVTRALLDLKNLRVVLHANAAVAATSAVGGGRRDPDDTDDEDEDAVGWA